MLALLRKLSAHAAFAWSCGVACAFWPMKRPKAGARFWSWYSFADVYGWADLAGFFETWPAKSVDALARVDALRR